MGQGAESCQGYEVEYDPYDDIDWLIRQEEFRKARIAVSRAKARLKAQENKKPQRGTKVEIKCKHCKNACQVRQADLNRGWGLFCSKSCKASYKKVS